ncbi:helix-turn-helix domain-containing protein [Streptomyces sp. NPDC054863]
MELNNEDDGEPTPCALLGRRLRRLREQADLSLRGLADKVGYPHTYLSRIERGEQLPSENLAEDLDTYFTTDGLFVELLSLAHDPSIPDYARVVVDSENRAARVQVFSSSLVPGLLQTENYALAVFRASLPGEPREKIDERVATRMRRKKVFEKADRPLYWAIVDEAALKRPVGGAACMAGQLRHILDAAEDPKITVQVLPFTQGEHPFLGGTLSLLTLHNGATLAYVESFASGEPADSPQRIIDLTQRFDLAREGAARK